MTKFGHYSADGKLEQEATECILTGRPVSVVNSQREQIPDTKWFYRILASQIRRVTEEMRETWRAEAHALMTLVEIKVREQKPAARGRNED